MSCPRATATSAGRHTMAGVDPQSDAFSSTAAFTDRRALNSALAWRGTVAVVTIALLAGVPFAPTLGLAPDAPWQMRASVPLMIAGIAGIALLAVRGILRCRRAPALLADAEGVDARVVTAGRSTDGVSGALTHLRTFGHQDFEFTVLAPPRHLLNKGDTGTLYRAGRAAAFVTDAGTYWVV